MMDANAIINKNIYQYIGNTDQYSVINKPNSELKHWLSINALDEN